MMFYLVFLVSFATAVYLLVFMHYSPAVKCLANQIEPQVINGSEVLVIRMKNPILQLANSSFYSSIFNVKRKRYDKNIIDPYRTPLKASMHYWWYNGTYNITLNNEINKENTIKIENIENENNEKEDVIQILSNEEIQSIEVNSDGSTESVINDQNIEEKVNNEEEKEKEKKIIQEEEEVLKKEEELKENKEEEKEVDNKEEELKENKEENKKEQLVDDKVIEKEKQSTDNKTEVLNISSSSSLSSSSIPIRKENKSKDDEFDILNILHQILSADLTDDLSYEFEDIEFKYGNERGLLLLSDKSLKRHNISTSFITINSAMDCFQYPEKLYFVLTSDLDICMFNAIRALYGDKGIFLSTVSSKFYWLQAPEDVVDYILDFVLMIVPIYIQLALLSRFINRSLTSSIKAIHFATTNRRFRFRYIVYACFDVFFTLGCIYCYILFVVGSNADVTFLLVFVGFIVEIFSLYFCRTRLSYFVVGSCYLSSTVLITNINSMNIFSYPVMMYIAYVQLNLFICAFLLIHNELPYFVSGQYEREASLQRPEMIRSTRLNLDLPPGIISCLRRVVMIWVKEVFLMVNTVLNRPPRNVNGVAIQNPHENNNVEVN